MPQNRNTQAETSLCLPAANSPPEMNKDQKEMWYKLASRDTRISLLKLMFEIFNWGLEFVATYTTLFFMVRDKNENDPFIESDIFSSIVVHVVGCFVRLLTDFTAPDSNRIQGKRSSKTEKCRSFFRFLANIVMLLKPYRDVKRYFFYERQSKPVRNQLKFQTSLTKDVVESVVAMNHKELLDENYKVTENFVRTVPTSLFQLYILFQANQSFQLCSHADASRMFLILNCIYSSAKCVSEYNKANHYYVKSLHFQYFFETGHPINTEMETRLTFVMDLICNASLILHRFFCISFFLSANILFAVVYIITSFFSQWSMLLLYPSLRVPFENPPFGAPTILSEIIDRWINIFTNHSTKYTWLTWKHYKIGFWESRLPLCLLQIIPFVITMGVVFGFSQCINDDWDNYQLFRSIKRRPNMSNTSSFNVTEDFIPCTNYTLEGQPQWIVSIGEFVFQTHHSFSNRFLSFKDIFGVFHFLPFSMYTYLACSLTYSSYLSWNFLNDPMYPVHRAYEFWHCLVQELLKRSSEKSSSKAPSLKDLFRSLMVLTLLEESEFYKIFYRSFFPCPCRQPFYIKASSLADILVKDVTLTRSDARNKLHQVFATEHPLLQDFKTIYKIVKTKNNNNSNANDNHCATDTKLFLLYYSKFDNIMRGIYERDVRMRGMNSFRIGCTFWILNVTLNKLPLE